jgi:transcriptional regulator with XRE-family HTH domain
MISLVSMERVYLQGSRLQFKKGILMNSFNEELLLCGHCKAKIKSIEDMLFVEEGRTRGFCSENCIEHFFKNAISHYESLDKKYRKEKKLDREDALRFVGIPKYMEAVIRRPTEVWRLENNLGEEVYAFMATLRDDANVPFEMIILCTVLDNRPAFIFLATATRNSEYASLFRIGEEIKQKDRFYDTPSEGHELGEIDRETLDIIEGKKSKYLATLLEKMSPADIPFEDFMYYDSYLAPTLENPDEVYKYRDEDGDDIIITIKAHEKNQVSFYYFVICLVDKDKSFEDGDTIYPILSFPSSDGEIYHTYKRGTLLSGSLRS